MRLHFAGAPRQSRAVHVARQIDVGEENVDRIASCSARSASAALLTACTQKPCSDSDCATHSLMRNSSSTNSTWIGAIS